MTPVRQRLAGVAQGVVALAGAATIGLVFMLAVAGYPARDVAFLLVGAGLAGVAWLNPRFSIVAVVAAFVFSGLARRLVPDVDPTSDAAAVFPFLVALPLAVRGIAFKKPAAVTAFLGWTVVGVGVAAAGAPLVGIGGWLNLAVPLLAAFGIRRTPEGAHTFARATVVCGSIAATYGIVQYLVPIPWDLAWLSRAGIESIGVYGTSSFRPFATLPAPQTAAMLSAVVILLVVFQHRLVGASSALRVWALCSTSILLLLTLARTVWAALALALLVGLLANRGRPARQLVPLVAVALLFVFVAPPGDIITSRASTITELSQDRSYNARLDVLMDADLLVSPVGLGLGSLSAASRADITTIVDNGYLVVLGELGVVGVGLFAWVLVWLFHQSRPPEYPIIALLLVTGAGGFVFANLPGLLLWVFSGIGRPRGGEPGPTQRAAAPVPAPSPRSRPVRTGGRRVTPYDRGDDRGG